MPNHDPNPIIEFHSTDWRPGINAAVRKNILWGDRIEIGSYIDIQDAETGRVYGPALVLGKLVTCVRCLNQDLLSLTPDPILTTPGGLELVSKREGHLEKVEGGDEVTMIFFEPSQQVRDRT